MDILNEAKSKGIRILPINDNKGAKEVTSIEETVEMIKNFTLTEANRKCYKVQELIKKASGEWDEADKGEKSAKGEGDLEEVEGKVDKTIKMVESLL